jgi:predicted NBD/HSP70 family sugar kinase
MSTIEVKYKTTPKLDPDFVPAVIWNREFLRLCEQQGSQPLSIALLRTDGTVSLFETKVLADHGQFGDLNVRYVERLVKFLLWQKGGYRVLIGGSREIADAIAQIYSPTGERAFDFEFMGDKIYGEPMTVEFRELADMPASKETAKELGRNLDGCRIGFDLGGSDRKCAALIDGEVVFSQEVEWNPYFESDPHYHIEGVNNSLELAAAHLPRVDAIGGSAAGVYVNNEARVASLFRGIGDEDFKQHIQRIFYNLKERWNNVPFEVVNDGEVTALAGSMSLNDNAVLGISMGTSLAAGYVTPEGKITPWLNELAFVPVDYRAGAPVDEWSGDGGCGVQYFSQQGVARLAPKAGIELPEDMPFAERLVKVQELMEQGDPRAAEIFETIGICFGYTLAHFSDFYDFRNLLILGRVTSGKGGEIIIAKAEQVLKDEFPELAAKITLRTPDEQSKRHGQAIAAASLPSIG